jgi:hypothetical protein
MTQNVSDDHKSFVTTTQGMSGWFAVQYWWNDQEPDIGGFWEPWDTGMGRYATESEAIQEAQMWANGLGLEYKARDTTYDRASPPA